MLGHGNFPNGYCEWQVLNQYLIFVYQLFPPFNLGRGLANLAALDFKSTLKGGTGDPYEWDVIGKSFTLMLVEAAGFIVLTLLIDNNGLINSWHSLFAQPTHASPFDLHSGKVSPP